MGGGVAPGPRFDYLPAPLERWIEITNPGDTAKPLQRPVCDLSFPYRATVGKWVRKTQVLLFLGQKCTKFCHIWIFEINLRSLPILTTRIWNLGGKCLRWPKLYKKVTIFFKCPQFLNRWIFWDSKHGFGFISMASKCVSCNIALWCWQVS